jgi:Protein-L-isoaspartate(D-aspartate) O-methyltransferase (PCMT)
MLRPACCGYRARVVSGDGREGFAAAAPYDRIVVTASTEVVPVAWFKQYVSAGLLEVPIRLSAAGAQAIPLLRRGEDGFRSIDVIAGGFMPLRSGDATAAASLKRAALIARDATAQTGASITELYGEALTTLTGGAKRRLVSLALGEPRKRALSLRASPAGSRSFCRFDCLDEMSLQPTAPRFGIGVISRNGRSLALIEPCSGGRATASTRSPSSVPTTQRTCSCATYASGISAAVQTSPNFRPPSATTRDNVHVSRIAGRRHEGDCARHLYRHLQPRALRARTHIARANSERHPTTAHRQNRAPRQLRGLIHEYHRAAA